MNWIAVASLFTGGAFGALLTIGYNRWSGRAQPVAYEVSTESVFSSAPHAGTLQAQAQVEHDGQTYQFDSLYFVRVSIKNKGNRDLDSFGFGVTLAGDHAAVLCFAEGTNRHHTVDERDPKASPAVPRQDLDFVCAPFNRRDRYDVRLYIKNKGAVEPQHVELTTPVPIRFVRVEFLDQLSSRTSALLILATSLGSGFAALLAFSFVAAWLYPTNADDGASSVSQTRLQDGSIEKVLEIALDDGSILRERRIDGDLVEKRIVTKEEQDQEMERFMREEYDRLKKRFEGDDASELDK